MAVYTSLTTEDIAQLLSEYEIGVLSHFQEISTGIENTNYFVTTLRDENPQRWVLTLFENLSQDDLPYFCDLTRHLAQDGLKVPAPVADRSGRYVFTVKGKFGVFVPCLTGSSVEVPDANACALIGRYVARMHISLCGFSGYRTLQRDLDWMQEQLSSLQKVMNKNEFVVLEGYFCRYRAYQPHLLQCPQGTIHGDLFRDNVLFEEGHISGVLDFYHACNATLLFDLAVVANDWAVDVDGAHDRVKLQCLCEAYQAQRPWTDKEKIMWPYCLELAAFRFFLSRLVSCHLPGYQQQSLAGDTIKDPNEMKAILLGLAKPNDLVSL
jgi:homoserine kinase type II